MSSLLEQYNAIRSPWADREIALKKGFALACQSILYYELGEEPLMIKGIINLVKELEVVVELAKKEGILK